MKKVFVSGTYDIVHGGHVQFFKDAKALGDYLIVSFASDAVIMAFKGRVAALPEQHRRVLLENLRMIDEVVMGTLTDDPVFDFKDHFVRLKPDILVSTEDDKNAERKRVFCQEHGAVYMQIPKSLDYPMTSTTEIRAKICNK